MRSRKFLPSFARRAIDLAEAPPRSDTLRAIEKFYTYTAVKEDQPLAITYLETVVDENFPVYDVHLLHSIPDHPISNAIRSHPKFDELVRRAGLPFESAE